MNPARRAAVGRRVLVVLFSMLLGTGSVAADQDPPLRHATMQAPDGRWPARQNGAADPADLRVSSWMLLALLGDGNTVRQGPQREPLRRTAKWLIAQQDAQGRLGLHTGHDWLLDHAIATCAIAEALSEDTRQDAAAPVLAAVGSLQRELARQRPVPGVEVRVWSLLAAKALRVHRGDPADPARAIAADALQASIVALPALPKPGKEEPTRQRCARLLFHVLLPDIWAPNWSDCYPEDPQSDPLAAFYAMVAGWQTGGTIWQRISTRYEKVLTGSKLPLASIEATGTSGEENGTAGATALRWLQLSLFYRYCRLTCAQ